MHARQSQHHLQTIVTRQLEASATGVDSTWQLYKSCRAPQLHLEHLYYVTGPSRADALRAGANTFVQAILGVLRGRVHLCHVMAVRTGRPLCFAAERGQSRAKLHVLPKVLQVKLPVFTGEALASMVLAACCTITDLSMSALHLCHKPCWLQVGGKALRCDALLQDSDAVATSVAAAAAAALKASKHPPSSTLPVLASQVSMFVCLAKDMYVPLLLDLRLHWAPTHSAADILAGDTDRCAPL